MSASEGFTWIENNDGDRRECECCGCEAPLKDFRRPPRQAHMKPLRDARLCKVCSSTYFSHEDRTCLSWWYPKIEGLVPTPKTEIVRAGIELWKLLDGHDPEGFDEFCGRLAEAGSRIQSHQSTGYLFLRTGHTSGKHSWDACCRVGLGDSLQSHVACLVEFSSMAGFFGLPFDVWAVRQMLPVDPLFRCHAYGNMPVVPERRYFVDGGQMLYSIPYWPEQALQEGQPDDPNWRDKLPIVQQEFSEEAANMARKCGEACGGKWSVDVLLTRDGYYVTDMAEAEKSWGWKP